MIREWLKRRYIEADYRFYEAVYGRWWDESYVKRRRNIRMFWEFLGGRA